MKKVVLGKVNIPEKILFASLGTGGKSVNLSRKFRRSMINRRNIRSKVMQELYALLTEKEATRHADPERSVKRLFTNLENIYKLYLLLLNLPVEIRRREVDLLERRKKKHLKTPEDLHPDTHLLDNRIGKLLEQNRQLEKETARYGLQHIWSGEPELVRHLLDKVKASAAYKHYVRIPDPDFKADKHFALDAYKNIIAPDEKLHGFLENMEINWADDIAIANTMVMKTLDKFEPNDTADKPLLPLFKSEDDREFGRDLLLHTFQNRDELSEIIAGKVKNWDFNRLSQVDKILLMMGLAEMLYFPTIPPTVSINEYVEIAKEFSTPKSNKFINGILDSAYKDLLAQNRIHKVAEIPKNQ